MYSRSPRWSSGYPRTLLALVLEFDSHRGEILNLFAKMQKKNQLLRTPSSAGWHDRHGLTREENTEVLSRKKNVEGKGEEGPVCDLGSELLLGGSARAVRGQ